MTGGGWYWAKATLRRRLRSTGLLVALVAVATAIPLAALGGAHRTATSWDRFLVETRSFDFGIALPDPEAVSVAQGVFDDAGIDHGTLQFVPLVPRQLSDSDAGSFVLGAGAARDVFVPVLLDGRLPAPERDDELTVNEVMAEQADLHVGAQVELVPTEGSPEMGPFPEMTVVGIHRSTLDLGVNAGFPNAFMPEAFDRYVPMEFRSPIAVVRLPEGVEEPELRESIAAAFPDDEQPLLMSASSASAAVEDVVSVQAAALAGLGVVAAVAGLVVAAQAVARETRGRAAERQLVVALGAGRRQALTAQVLPVGLSVLGGVAIGLGAAFAASDRFPFGLSGDAEPDPGLRFDPLAHGAGAAVVLTALIAVAVLVASADDQRSGRASRWPVLGGSAFAVGLRWALTSRLGGDRAPVRAGFLSVGVALAGAVLVTTFTASILHLQESPELYGWDFDLVVNAGEDAEDPGAVLDEVAADSLGASTAVARGRLLTATIDGRGTEVFVIDPVEQRITMTVSEGRAPVGPDELTVGRDLASDLGVSVGDEVLVGGGTSNRSARVTGIGAYPELGDVGMSQAVSMGPELAAAAGLEGGMEQLFLRLDDERGDAWREHLEAREDLGVDGPFTPPTVGNLDQIGRVPSAALLTLALLGLGGFAHASATSARRRRRELAVLRCLGFSRGQARVATLIQAAVIVVIASAGGLLVGLVSGTWLWDTFAIALGVRPEAVTPTAGVGWSLAAAVVALAVIGAPVAWFATRMPPGRLLRTE